MPSSSVPERSGAHLILFDTAELAGGPAEPADHKVRSARITQTSENAVRDIRGRPGQKGWPSPPAQASGRPPSRPHGPDGTHRRKTPKAPSRLLIRPTPQSEFKQLATKAAHPETWKFPDSSAPYPGKPPPAGRGPGRLHRPPPALGPAPPGPWKRGAGGCRASCRYSRSRERPACCRACRPCPGRCAWPYASRTVRVTEWPRCSPARR